MFQPVEFPEVQALKSVGFPEMGSVDAFAWSHEPPKPPAPEQSEPPGKKGLTTAVLWTFLTSILLGTLHSLSLFSSLCHQHALPICWRMVLSFAFSLHTPAHTRMPVRLFWGSLLARWTLEALLPVDKALASVELTLALACRPAAEPETPDYIPRCGGCTTVHSLCPVR